MYQIQPVNMSEDQDNGSILLSLSRDLTDTCFNKCYKFRKELLGNNTVVVSKGDDCMDRCISLNMEEFVKTTFKLMSLEDDD